MVIFFSFVNGGLVVLFLEALFVGLVYVSFLSLEREVLVVAGPDFPRLFFHFGQASRLS